MTDQHDPRSDQGFGDDFRMSRAGLLRGAAGVVLAVATTDDPAEVLAAPGLLRAGLEHLRERAERVTPAGGRVEVRTQSRTEGGRRVVEVAVTDGGPRLADDRLARLFDPYPDAESVQDGTGLELAALAGIVRDHGGSISASAAGIGTTILVRLPARPASETQPS